jgi:hypothetical protein
MFCGKKKCHLLTSTKTAPGYFVANHFVAGYFVAGHFVTVHFVALISS